MEKIERLEFIDYLRGVSLIAMTLFHLGWDLELLGIVPKGFASQPAMKWFAVCIASSFLFLVGINMLLAHQHRFNSNAFFKREIKIVAACILITIATYFATPNFYIFFGILHHIALGSILGLLFIKLPYWLNLIAGIFVFAIGNWGKSELFAAPILSWTGLGTYTPTSSDYVPLFPFFTAILFGIAFAQLALKNAIFKKFEGAKFDTVIGRPIKFIGRNSLLYYLIHQPILLGVLGGGVYMWRYIQ